MVSLNRFAESTVSPGIFVAVTEYVQRFSIQLRFVMFQYQQVRKDIPVQRASGAAGPLHAVLGVAAAVAYVKPFCIVFF